MGWMCHLIVNLRMALGMVQFFLITKMLQWLTSYTVTSRDENIPKRKILGLELLSKRVRMCICHLVDITRVSLLRGCATFTPISYG